MVETIDELGLVWFENRSAYRSFSFLPQNADVQRDDEGAPMVSLLAAGTTGFLMLTGVWQAGADVLEALRKELAERYTVDDPATITLAFAPVRSVSCDLVLGEGAAATTVATSRTAGSPPFSALFNVSLTGSQLAAAAAALTGRPGFLAVEYHASVIAPVAAGARLVGADAGFVPWLRSSAATGPAGLRAAIEQAVADGLARVVMSMPGDPPAALVADLYDHVLDRAVELVPSFLGSPSADAAEAFEVEVEILRDVEERITVRADLAGIDGRDSIRLPAGILPAEVAPEAARTSRVRLGFDPGGAPLAWVRLRRGDASAVLEAPGFAPVDLPVGDQPLQVVTGYRDGSPNHAQDLPEQAGEVVLTSRDLGLAEVTVDGRPLARDGAVAAEVLLTHRPRTGGERRHTVRLEAGGWTTRWWLVVPAGAAPSVDYRWTATAADGRAVRGSHAHAATGTIVLSFSEGTGDVADRQSPDH